MAIGFAPDLDDLVFCFVHVINIQQIVVRVNYLLSIAAKSLRVVLIRLIFRPLDTGFLQSCNGVRRKLDGLCHLASQGGALVQVWGLFA